MKKLSLSIASLIITLLSFYFFFWRIDIHSLDYVSWIILSACFLMLVITSILFMVFFYRKTSDKIKWLENRLEIWNNISYHVNKAGDEVFNELPIGIVVYDDDLEITWANRYAKATFQNRLIEKTLEDTHKDLNKAVQNKEEHFTINVLNNYYDVIHRPVNHLLYFFDVTEKEEITKKYHNRIPAMGVIIIDNLEESIKRFDIQEKSNIRGQYLGEISEWAHEYNAFLRSFDDDRLIVLMDRESLDRMVADKFSVLNKVRDISSNNHLRATLSIGIACYDVKIEELGAYAQNAVDLAEKRGGDQAVVNIQNEKVMYFGAKTNALEKNSLVSARVQTLTLKELIEQAPNIFIMGHEKADCDCLGAMIGVLKMCLSSEKDAKIVYEADSLDFTCQKIFHQLINKNEETLKYMVELEDVNDIRNNSLLIVVDTQSPKIVMCPEFLTRFKNVAVIDHHRQGEVAFEEPVFSYIEPYASSSVELVSEMFLFYNQNIPLTQMEATIMLTGIVVDTNNFTYRTGVRTFEAASTLRQLGAEMINVRTILRDDIEEEIFMSQALSNVKMLLNRFAIIAIPQEKIVTDRASLAKISEQALNIDKIDASFTIAMISNDTVGISARSYMDVNVQLIMEELGGGGHLNSAATQIKNVSIEEAIESLTIILKRDYENVGEEKMKIILIEDVKGRGQKDDIIEVASGYGNYLISNKKGVLATDEALKELSLAQKQAKEDAEAHLKLMTKLKEEIESKSINIYIKLGIDGKVFGSITAKNVTEEFEAQTGIHLDKRKVSLSSQINSIGIFQGVVSLAPGLNATFEINVIEK